MSLDTSFYFHIDLMRENLECNVELSQTLVEMFAIFGIVFDANDGVITVAELKSFVDKADRKCGEIDYIDRGLQAYKLFEPNGKREYGEKFLYHFLHLTGNGFNGLLFIIKKMSGFGRQIVLCEERLSFL